MAGTKNKPKAPKGTGKELDVAGAGDSAAATANSGSESKASKGVKGDPTGKSTPMINTGATALPNEHRAAPVAAVPELKKGESKEVYLDKVYTYHGRHYGPSAHPGDYVKVPKDFPEEILAPEPSLKEWRPAAESAVIEIPDESNKTL